VIGIPKPRPRILEKREAARELEKLKRQVYAAVDARDQKRCRVCNRRGNPYALDPLGKIHHCHIQDASLGGAMSTENVFSGCWICHALIHAKQLFVIGRNANEWLEFEVMEAAVVEVFGTRHLPPHVRIILPAQGSLNVIR
jgi:hypothetical protein